MRRIGEPDELSLEPAEVALAQAAILDVPFVDVVTDMSDPSLPLTTMEYDEW